MTKQEYAAYKASVARFFADTEIKFFSQADSDSEPYFSWRVCDCCQRPLGGDREDYIAENRFTYSICTDCVYYIEYGCLDDMTMLEIEQSK